MTESLNLIGAYLQLKSDHAKLEAERDHFKDLYAKLTNGTLTTYSRRDLEDVTNKIENLKSEVTYYEDESKRLRAENQKAVNEIKELKAKHNKALQEIDDLQVQNRALAATNQDFKTVNKNLQIQNVEMQSKIDNQYNKYASHLMCNIMRELKIDFPMIVITNQTEKDILERRIQDLKNGFTVLQNRIGYVESLIANSKSENEKLKTQNQNLKSENQKWETDYQKLYDRNIALKTDSANYKKDIEVLESEKEYFKNCWINADRIARRLAKALDDIRQIINPPLESYTE